MVTFRYKGHRASAVRTDGGRSITFHPGEIHEFDENDKRYKNFVAQIIANKDNFEIQSKVGTKKVGGGVRTRSKTPRKSKEVKSLKSKVQSKVDKALKKGKGLRKSKGKAK